MKLVIPSASLLALVVTMSACGAKLASVAVNPISGKVFVTRSDSLDACDQSAQNCSAARLAFKPVSAAIGPDGGLVFLTSSAVYRCDDVGQNCKESKLPISDAVGIGVAASGQVIAVSKKGEVALCDSGGCQKAARGP